jgi:DNA-binding CsgD family transcriptional regulator
VRGQAAVDHAVAAIAETCQRGLRVGDLRAAVLPRLRRLVAVDAVWWASADPTTLLFTEALREEIPADSGPYFVENELLRNDVNKWVDLARDPIGVRTLMQATDGKPARSARYRDIFAPLGLTDELRAVLRAPRDGATWGFLCLHREGTFSAEEVARVRRVVPYVAEAMRAAIALDTAQAEELHRPPGLLLVGPDDRLLGANEAADAWCDELGTPLAMGLPLEVRAVAVCLRGTGPTKPIVRVRTRARRWAIVEASWMTGVSPGAISVIVREAVADELAPLVMRVFGLSERERSVCGLVFRGHATRSIAERLCISENTVQDHLKAIFDKTGVRTRRELVATVLRQQYLPRAKR